MSLDKNSFKNPSCVDIADSSSYLVNRQKKHLRSSTLIFCSFCIAGILSSFLLVGSLHQMIVEMVNQHLLSLTLFSLGRRPILRWWTACFCLCHLVVQGFLNICNGTDSEVAADLESPLLDFSCLLYCHRLQAAFSQGDSYRMIVCNPDTYFISMVYVALLQAGCQYLPSLLEQEDQNIVVMPTGSPDAVKLTLWPTVRPELLDLHLGVLSYSSFFPHSHCSGHSGNHMEDPYHICSIYNGYLLLLTECLAAELYHELQHLLPPQLLLPQHPTPQSLHFLH